MSPCGHALVFVPLPVVSCPSISGYVNSVCRAVLTTNVATNRGVLVGGSCWNRTLPCSTLGWRNALYLTLAWNVFCLDYGLENSIQKGGPGRYMMETLMDFSMSVNQHISAQNSLLIKWEKSNISGFWKGCVILWWVMCVFMQAEWKRLVEPGTWGSQLMLEWSGFYSS